MSPHVSPRGHNPPPRTNPTCSKDGILTQTPESHQLTFIDSQLDRVSRLSADVAAKHRHAIFTETERQLMSNQVVESVPDQDPARALLDLDRFDDSGFDTMAPSSVFHGPFGVSRLLPHESYTKPIGHGVEEALLSPDHWLTGLDEPIEDPSATDLFSSLLDIPDDIPDVGPEIWDSVPSEDARPFFTTDPPVQISPTYFTSNAEAWSILAHYRDRIGPLISPFGQGQETLWMKLAMPCAVQTLGELTMGGPVAHARLALLNAVLSTSAFHLWNTNSLAPCTEYWRPAGNDYLKRAQHHFIRCLEDAYSSTTKKNKYKEILMAVLSLSTAYMVNGDSEKRRSCLLQTGGSFAPTASSTLPYP